MKIRTWNWVTTNRNCWTFWGIVTVTGISLNTIQDVKVLPSSVIAILSSLSSSSVPEKFANKDNLPFKPISWYKQNLGNIKESGMFKITFRTMETLANPSNVNSAPTSAVCWFLSRSLQMHIILLHFFYEIPNLHFISRVLLSYSIECHHTHVVQLDGQQKRQIRLIGLS